MVYLRLTRLRSNTPSDVAQWTHEPNADNIDCSGEQKPDAHETGVTTASLLPLVHANSHLKEQCHVLMYRKLQYRAASILNQLDSNYPYPSRCTSKTLSNKITVLTREHVQNELRQW